MTHKIHPAAPLKHRASVRVRSTATWLTPIQAASRLGVSRQRVDALVQEGRFATVTKDDEGRRAVRIADHCVEAERRRELCACRDEREEPGDGG